MNFNDACFCCHVRSAIYRKSKPGERYWKNHPIPLADRVSAVDQAATDWDEYDPREDVFEAVA